MERVRIADINKGPYGSNSRCIYQALNKSDPRTNTTSSNTPQMDLLQTLPGIEEIRENTRNPNATLTRNSNIMNQNRETVHLEDTNPIPPTNDIRYAGDITVQSPSQMVVQNSEQQQVVLQQQNPASSCTQQHHIFESPPPQTQQNSSCAHIFGETPLQQQALSPEENVYLCHKHARELENHANTIYGRIGDARSVYLNDANGSQMVAQNMKRTNQNGDTIYCNKLFKNRRKSKDELRFSTQSLPAVTYNSKQDGNKTTLWAKSGFLFRSSKRATRNKSNSKRTDKNSATYTVSSANMDRSFNVKKLLLVTCILVGIVLAIGGVAIGLLTSSQGSTFGGKECGSDHVLCGEAGCISYTNVCASEALHLCPNYVSALCSQFKTANKSSSMNVTPETVATVDETQIYMDIIFDERGWAKYTNSSNRASKYKVLDSVTPYSQAQQLCFRKGGHLVHINSLREQLFIEQFLRMQTEPDSASSDVYIPKGYWIGARRARGSHSGTCAMKQWRWLNANSRPFGDVTSFSAFAPGKPDNYHNPEECLYISTSDKYGENSFLKWDDIPCDMPSIARLLPLCEVELRHL